MTTLTYPELDARKRRRARQIARIEREALARVGSARHMAELSRMDAHQLRARVLYLESTRGALRVLWRRLTRRAV